VDARALLVSLGMAVARDLAFDVGMHDGRDTAYYLRRGLRVVAVDANPALVESARVRFAREIDQERLTIVCVGVGEVSGEASFWVCDDHLEWSSFDRAVASRNGSRHHQVRVPVRPFDELLAEYGVPRYCKIDIEGNDHLCVNAIRPEGRPEFLSVELSRGPLIQRMSDLGYDRFKLIHQMSFCPVNTTLQSLKVRLGSAKVAHVLERSRGLAHGSLFDGLWWFGIGSSGPLPDGTPGAWSSRAEVEAAVAEVRALDAKRPSYGEWFDIHATSSQGVDGSSQR
jgi:FkbM family methyltransferase